MIQEELQLQLADSRHIQISQTQVNTQLQQIADQQKITIAELYQQATEDWLHARKLSSTITRSNAYS